ncbi:MAG: pyridoxal phosphate-dependent aminotransferase [Thermodesulfobacteriota bacterium]
MRIATRLSQIKPSPTLGLNAQIQEMQAQGRSVVSLAVGEPDFPTPPHICQAAKTAIDEGFTGYTAVPGTPALRQAVADYYTRIYQVQANKEAVIVSNGGKQVLYNLLQALVEPGDGVLLPVPYWVSYPPLIALAGGEVQAVSSVAEEEFLVTVEQLEACRTDTSRFLILNTPSNPTGSHYSQAQLDSILQWALEHNLFVICDEIYDQLVYPPARPATASHWWETAPDSVAVVNGLSKSFAMTGWRVGFGLAHPELIKAMTKLQGQSTSNICSIAQKAAEAALNGPWENVHAMRESFARRRDLALEIIATWPGTTCSCPSGAFYLFPHVGGCLQGTITDSTALATHILEQAGIAVVPGAAFGDDACLRLSYAVDEMVLSEALHRIGEVLQDLVSSPQH